MRCPYCDHSLTELATECPGCRLNLSRATGLLGPVPRLEPRVADHTGALDRREIRRLHKQIRNLSQVFPQLKIQIVCYRFPEDHPLSLYIFWLFNKGGISTDQEKAGNNRTILIVLDPIGRRSAAMVGYGLEPFIDRKSLDDLLQLAEPSWTDQAWFEGFEAILDGLGPMLDTAIRHIGEAFLLPIHPEVTRGGEF